MNTNLQLLPEFEAEPVKHVKVAYVGSGFQNLIIKDIASVFEIEHHRNLIDFDAAFQNMDFLGLPDVLILELEEAELCFTFIEKIKTDPSLQGFIIIIISQDDRPDWKFKAFELKVQDYYVYPFKLNKLKSRIQYLIKLRIVKPSSEKVAAYQAYKNKQYQMPIGKRVFDILLSGLALFFLSPLFLIIALAIRLESRGAVIYKSKRVGTGYNVFNFYKFRSMHINADRQLNQLTQQNQYSDPAAEKSIYIKIANDPRVTKVGSFLRNTSLDELPQIYNILLGDMSFVGNRPLPLYEAELLTSDQWAMRFLGPAGLTGLWQVSKRGKKNMSEQERKELDNQYARHYSIWLDLKIILYTIPALIQQEKV